MFSLASGTDDLPESSAIPCRSEPARDRGVPANDSLTDTPLSRAGSLLQGNGLIVRDVKSPRNREVAGAFYGRGSDHSSATESLL